MSFTWSSSRPSSPQSSRRSACSAQGDRSAAAAALSSNSQHQGGLRLLWEQVPTRVGSVAPRASRRDRRSSSEPINALRLLAPVVAPSPRAGLAARLRVSQWPRPPLGHDWEDAPASAIALLGHPARRDSMLSPASGSAALHREAWVRRDDSGSESDALRA